MLYSWWEPVYYYNPDVPFAQLQEKLERFVGFVDNVGDVFCFKVVTATEEVITRSVLHSANSTINSNNNHLMLIRMRILVMLIPLPRMGR